VTCSDLLFRTITVVAAWKLGWSKNKHGKVSEHVTAVIQAGAEKWQHIRMDSGSGDGERGNLLER
jgi:hypothetical protein